MAKVGVSQKCQNAKYSVRADIFRFSSKLRRGGDFAFVPTTEVTPCAIASSARAKCWHVDADGLRGLHIDN
jgi:hypothetical protein